LDIHVVTGGAGFVAANLIPRLLNGGARVLALDDFSRGLAEHWAPFRNEPRFAGAQVDCSDADALRGAIERARGEDRVAEVWHLAANSDIPAGIRDPRVDLKDTFLTTFAVLAVMRDLAISAIRFASSSAVYGDLGETAIHEASGPLEPISNYGAMKLASEAQIRAAVESDGIRADVFRFPNVVGVPATHGVILDLLRKLKATPDRLDVLGDGTQTKSYLHVEELIEAMLFIARTASGAYNVFNIGPRDEGVSVRRIAETVRDAAAPGAAIRFGEGGRGWVGDVPRFRYDTGRLAALGWQPRLGSEDAVRRAVAQIAAQEEAVRREARA